MPALVVKATASAKGRPARRPIPRNPRWVAALFVLWPTGTSESMALLGGQAGAVVANADLCQPRVEVNLDPAWFRSLRCGVRRVLEVLAKREPVDRRTSPT